MEYLPRSIAEPLLSLSRTDVSSSSLPQLLIALATLYFAVISVYSSFRYALRFAFFCLKYSLLLAALVAVYATYTGQAIPFNTSLEYGKTAFGLGKRGVQYWAGVPSNRGGYSANGRKKSWPSLNDDGSYDDPNDLVSNQEAFQGIQDAVLGYLGQEKKESPRKLQKKGKNAKKGKAATTTGGGGLSGMAMEFAWGKARKMWDDLNDGNANGRNR